MYQFKRQKLKNSEAYKLIHDPVKLLQLLYSKYGDINEDFNEMHINSLLYNKYCHYLSIFKELQYLDPSDEFLKRIYLKRESTARIPKLSEYYKNYHLFFCRPIFRNYKIYDLMRNFGDAQAEVFYQNNYVKKNKTEFSNKKNKKNSLDKKALNSNESSISSLDNITNNKTIFDKRTRFSIDNIDNYNKKDTIFTITLESSRLYNGNNGLLNSKSSKNNSFLKMISGIIEQKTQNIKVKPKAVKGTKMKSSLCNLTKRKISYMIDGRKMQLSPKSQPFITTFKSSIGEFNKNKLKSKYSSQLYQTLHNKNKGSNISNNIHKFIRASSNGSYNNKSAKITITTSNMNTVTRKISTINNCDKVNGRISPIKSNNKYKNYDLMIKSPITCKTRNNSAGKAKRLSSLKTNSTSKNGNRYLHPSSSIPKYNRVISPIPTIIKESKSKGKKVNNVNNNKKEVLYRNMLMNFHTKRNNKYKIQSQRTANTNNTSNEKKSPIRNHKKSWIKIGDKVFNSRNKGIHQKNSLQSIKSVKCKNSSMRNAMNHNDRISITKSMDEKGMVKRDKHKTKSAIKKIESLIRKDKFIYSTNSSDCNIKQKGKRTSSQGTITSKIDINKPKKQSKGKYINVNINMNLRKNNNNNNKDKKIQVDTKGMNNQRDKK